MVTTPLRSHLLVGTVRHRRSRHVDYDFTHRVWYLALDLDEVDEACRRITVLSRNRRNLLELRDPDHEAASGGLEAGVHARIAAEGIDPATVRVTLITYPRALGYVFNPVSFYLCHDRTDGTLRLVLAEVNNTHGGRTVYAFHPSGGAAVRPGRQVFRAAQEKEMYVSPFVQARATYDLRAWEGDGRLTLSIHEREAGAGEQTLFASLRLVRRPLTNRQLLAVLVRDPLVPLKTTALIFWHALRLWRRGVPWHRYRRDAAKPGRGPSASATAGSAHGGTRGGTPA